MIGRIRGTVTYETGEVVAWRARPKDLAAMEDYARRVGIPIGEDTLSPKLAMFLAYSALGVPEGFETWLGSLDDFDDLSGEEEVVPFPVEASGEA